jgi:N-acetylglucosaminyldiphosphoundecaprenol N-acetyl-beta-D-mannosaminyltransferase
MRSRHSMLDAGRTRGAEAAMAAPRSLCVLGVRVDCVSMDDVLGLTARWVAEARAERELGRPVRTRHVVTLNPEIVMAARREADLRALIDAADLVLADGVGVVLAARLRRVRGLTRVTGVDTVRALAARAAPAGWRMYLLGGRPGVAAEAAAHLEAQHVGLRIGGTHAGSPAPDADTETTALIRAKAADIVCVAYGAPAQERWIARNQRAVGAAVAIGVGGTLDYLAGRIPRAPAPLRRVGLEWAYRLWREPWRWRRMLALPRFAVAVVGEALRLGPIRYDTDTI